MPKRHKRLIKILTSMEVVSHNYETDKYFAKTRHKCWLKSSLKV
jgi:hypothetical protein